MTTDPTKTNPPPWSGPVRAALRGALATAAVLAIALAVAVPGAFAQPVSAANVTAELISEHETIQPGRPFTVGIALRPSPGWHTYWMNPGETGLPTRVEWKLPAGFVAGAIEWPHPDRLGAPPYVAYGYEGDALLLVRVAAPAALRAGSVVELVAKTKWLACRDDACVPGKADLLLRVQVEARAPHRDSRWAEAFDAARARVPRALDGWSATAEDRGSSVRVTVRGPQGARPSTTDVEIFPTVAGIVDPSSEVVLHAQGDTLVLEAERSERAKPIPDPLGLVLVAEGGWSADAGARAIRVDAKPFAGGAADAPARRAEPALPGDASPGEAAPGKADARPGAADARTGGTDDPRGAGSAAAAAVAATEPAFVGDDGSPLTLWAAVVLAFGGGLLLNLMPCVFPVLSLKILGFVHVAHHRAAVVRRHGYAFTAGVLVSFWMLAGLLVALRSAGSFLGWGFQLQQPLFVASMAALLLAMALNLLGAWEVGSSVSGAAGRFDAASGYRGSFLSGALATLVATPCSAPFMGTAVGFALAQGPAVALAVFSALGAGMAAPYLLLSCAPTLLRRLPRPGPWMEILRQAMAFPLLATVAWLAWVFGRQAGDDALLRLLMALTLGAAGLWLAGRAAAEAASRRGRAVARFLGAAALVVALAMGASASRERAVAAGAATSGATDSTADSTVGVATGSAAQRTTQRTALDTVPWIAWSAERVDAERRAGRAVLVDFTADWCLTCKANEAVALSGAAFATLLRERGAVALKADWTSGDAAITAALESFGRSGVPLVVVYPRDPARPPEVLPQVLTPAVVADALARAAA